VVVVSMLVVASIRASVPSPLATQAAPSPTASRRGTRSIPIGIVAITPAWTGSIRVTLAAVAFSTHTDPSPVAIAIG